MTSSIAVPRRAAKRLVRVASSGLVRSLGTDATGKVAGRSCLVVAPHPDDETLGCGATIARMCSVGTRVDVVFASGGGLAPRRAGTALGALLETRRNEAFRALRILGIDSSHIRLWDFEDGALADHRSALAEALIEVLRVVAPEQVMVTSTNDRHPDHVAAAWATHSAVSRYAPRVPVLEYPIWQRVPALNILRGLPSARPVLVSTQGFLQQKREALDAYQSQLPHFPIGFVEDFAQPFETFVPARPVLNSPSGVPR